MASSSNTVLKAVEEESTPTPTSLLSRRRVLSYRHCSRQFSKKQALGGHQNTNDHSRKLRRLAPRPPISFGLSSITDFHHSSLSPSPNIISPHSSAQLGLRQHPFTPSLFGGLQSRGWDSQNGGGILEEKTEVKEAVFQPIAQNGGGSKIELKETVFQAIPHNGGGSKTGLKESVIHAIAHYGGGNRAKLKEPVFQPIAHNGPATIFGVLQSCGSKEAVFRTIAHNRPVTMFAGGEQYPCSLESDAQKQVGGLEASCHSFEISFKKGGQMSFQSSRVTTVMSEEEEELDLSLHL